MRVGGLGALVAALLCHATAQVAILQMQVVEGDGAAHAPGSRSARALTVEVTDETGKPVAGAAVSFHLPDDGPGGTLANGLRTDVVMTDARGRASMRGMRVNRTAGPFQIRILASKEQARAGVISTQYIAEPASGMATAAASKRRAKWVAVAAAIAGGAVAGIVTAGRHETAAAPTTPTTPTIPAATVTIGAPSATVGKP